MALYPEHGPLLPLSLQALVDTAKQQLLANRTQLHALSSTCGVSVQEDQEVLADFAAALEGWDQQSAQRNQGEEQRRARWGANARLGQEILAALCSLNCVHRVFLFLAPNYLTPDDSQRVPGSCQATCHVRSSTWHWPGPCWPGDEAMNDSGPLNEINMVFPRGGVSLNEAKMVFPSIGCVLNWLQSHMYRNI